MTDHIRRGALIIFVVLTCVIVNERLISMARIILAPLLLLFILTSAWSAPSSEELDDDDVYGEFTCIIYRKVIFI